MKTPKASGALRWAPDPMPRYARFARPTPLHYIGKIGRPELGPPLDQSWIRYWLSLCSMNIAKNHLVTFKCTVIVISLHLYIFHCGRLPLTKTVSCTIHLSCRKSGKPFSCNIKTVNISTKHNLIENCTTKA